MNPLFDLLNSQSYPPVLQQFMEFQKNFQGDPRARVQQMLSSGQISQAQFDEAVRKAQQLQSMLTPGVRR